MDLPADMIVRSTLGVHESDHPIRLRFRITGQGIHFS